MTTIGILGTSRRKDERRVPVHPDHFPLLPAEVRRRLVLEVDYASQFGLSAGDLEAAGLRTADRATLLRECEMVILPKPVPEDLLAMNAGQTLCGWPHCVQQRAITQAAIDRRLTVIAWEAMHHWSAGGERLLHIFQKNNEIAGYAAVLHCLQLLGIDGFFGPRRRVVVLGYGSVSRGAIQALHGRGFNNIHTFTRRPPHLVACQHPDVYHGQYREAADGGFVVTDSEGAERPLLEELGRADIICNGILQDPTRPQMFVRGGDVSRLKRGALIIDISCDTAMGFEFARPTDFEAPTFSPGHGVTYYSVDHTPTYLWNAASREISRALMPFLPTLAAGPAGWAECPTVRRAIEIRDGSVLNPHILEFQKRSARYPHEALPGSKSCD